MRFKYKNVLIALDDSEFSTKAFDRAVHIAERDGAKLTLVHVIDTKNFSIIKNYLDSINDVYKQAESDIKNKLDEYEQIAKSSGVLNIKKVIKFGSPKNILVEEIIPEEKIDLVMLGATGVNTVERVFLGSVADYTFRHSKCDVLVVR